MRILRSSVTRSQRDSYFRRLNSNRLACAVQQLLMIFSSALRRLLARAISAVRWLLTICCVLMLFHLLFIKISAMHLTLNARSKKNIEKKKEVLTITLLGVTEWAPALSTSSGEWSRLVSYHRSKRGRCLG